MQIEELMDKLDDVIDAAPAMPLSSKHLVDVDKLRDLLDEMRNNLPQEIRQAKAVVKDRTEIVASARKEAEAIVKHAEERARTMTAQEAIVKAAQQRANEIATISQSQTRAMHDKMNEYCDSILRKTEELMAKNVGEVKSLRANIRQSPAASARVTPRAAVPPAK